MQTNNRRRTWDRSDSRNNKRRKKRKRNPPSRWNIYSNAGKQALRDVNILRRYINTEFHLVDSVASNSSITSTPTLVLLNGLSLGDTTTTRTGQSIKMDRSDFRFIIRGNVTAVNCFMRVIVVVDKQTNATAMVSADLLVQDTVISPYTFASQQRFIPLYDETFALPSSGQSCITKMTGPNTNQHVTYNTSNNGTVADITSNSCYLILLSDQSVNTPTISYYYRLWFVDN